MAQEAANHEWQAPAYGRRQSKRSRMSLWNRLSRALSYDGAESSKSRKAPSGIQQSEDRELPAEKRRKLLSASRDIQRNFALAAWMIRRHLDYVTTFSFQAKT